MVKDSKPLTITVNKAKATSNPLLGSIPIPMYALLGILVVIIVIIAVAAVLISRNKKNKNKVLQNPPNPPSS